MTAPTQTTQQAGGPMPQSFTPPTLPNTSPSTGGAYWGPGSTYIPQWGSTAPELINPGGAAFLLGQDNQWMPAGVNAQVPTNTPAPVDPTLPGGQLAPGTDPTGGYRPGYAYPVGQAPAATTPGATAAGGAAIPAGMNRVPLYVGNANAPAMHDLQSWAVRQGLINQAPTNLQAQFWQHPEQREAVLGEILKGEGWKLAPGNVGLISPWAPQGFTPPSNMGTASYWDMHPGQAADQAMQGMNAAMGMPANWSLGGGATSTSSQPTQSALQPFSLGSGRK